MLRSTWNDLIRVEQNWFCIVLGRRHEFGAFAVVNLRPESSGARIVDTADPSQAMLAVATSQAVISYDLVKDWEGPLRESVRHLFTSR